MDPLCTLLGWEEAWGPIPFPLPPCLTVCCKGASMEPQSPEEHSLRITEVFECFTDEDRTFRKVKGPIPQLLVDTPPLRIQASWQLVCSCLSCWAFHLGPFLWFLCRKRGWIVLFSPFMSFTSLNLYNATGSPRFVCWLLLQGPGRCLGNGEIWADSERCKKSLLFFSDRSLFFFFFLVVWLYWLSFCIWGYSPWAVCQPSNLESFKSNFPS